MLHRSINSSYTNIKITTVTENDKPHCNTFIVKNLYLIHCTILSDHMKWKYPLIFAITAFFRRIITVSVNSLPNNSRL